MKLSINSQNLVLWLLIPFVSLTSHTILPIPPPIVLLFFSIFPFIFYISKKGCISINFSCFLIIYYLFYLIVSQIIIGAPLYQLGGKVFPYLFYIITFLSLKNVKQEFLERLINIFINLSILIFIFEFIFRFHNSSFYSNSIQNLTGFFHNYKNHSIMYSDSNATAIHILTVFFFLFYIQGKILIKYINVKKTILLFLVILTFSRAGWVSVILGYIFVKYIKKNISIKRIVFIVLLLSILGIILYVFFKPYLNSDQSYMEHIGIWNIVAEFTKKANFITLLFGVGISQSIKNIGIYTHNYFLTSFVETGIIGLLFEIIIYCAFVWQSNGKALIVIVPFLIAVMVSNFAFAPFFYVIMAIIVHYEQKNNFSII